MRRTVAGHSSWKRGAGRYSARRLTTAAAVTSALSLRNGIEPWPGVPWTRSRRQATPFSPTVTLDHRVVLGAPSWRPPLSVRRLSTAMASGWWSATQRAP